MTIILESFRQSMNESDEFIHGPDVISTLRGAEDRTEIVNAINDIDDEILKEKAEGIVQKGFDDGVEIEIIISKLINTIKDSQPDVGFDDFGSFDETNPFTDDLSDFGDESAEDSDDLVDNEPIEDEPAEEEEAADDLDFKFEALIRHNLKHRRTASYERNILGESYDDTWKLVDKKQVLDYDGFYTEYAWYSDGNGKHIFMFGDTDIYEPDEYDADHVVEGSYSEAEEWFDDYEGFVDEDFSSTRYSDLNTSCKDCDSDFKGKSQKWDSWEAPERKEGRPNIIDKDEEDLNEANMFNQHYRYEVHAPRGQNYVVGGSKDLEGASQVAINFIEEHILDNPWEKLQDKITRINDMYIYDSDEDEIVEVDSFEDYVDRLLSELYSRKNESLEEDTEEVKKLKSRLNDINNAIEKGADPERLSYEKGKIMDRLEELGETNFYESLKFSDMYDNVYVEFRDGEPTFAYETLGDASYGMSMSMSGDFEHDLGSHEYTIMKLEDGVYYPVKGYEPISGINESLEETDLKGIYFFNQGDRVIRNHEDESYADYYTEEEINAITIYPATPKLWNAWLNDEDSSLWPVYDTHNGYSTDPVRCKDREEAREYLEELLNFSIYEYNHDI